MYCGSPVRNLQCEGNRPPPWQLQPFRKNVLYVCPCKCIHRQCQQSEQNVKRVAEFGERIQEYSLCCSFLAAFLSAPRKKVLKAPCWTGAFTLFLTGPRWLGRQEREGEKGRTGSRSFSSLRRQVHFHHCF